MNEEIQNLLDAVPASNGGGKYLNQLSPEGREVLSAFEKWLKDEDKKSETTARAYKGYIAKAMVEIAADPDVELDTDVRSAVNALRRFKLATSGSAPVPLADDVDDAE